MDKVSYWRTSLGKEETQGVVDAISKEYISQGPFIAEFEDQLAKALDIPYVILTPSGSCALLIALMALDVGPGDEVIVPNRTFIATAHAPLVLGAKVVLADVLPDIPNMDVSQIREKITPRTKTIIPVHRNGRAVDMEELNNIAKEYRLPVIEDACQALFSRNAIGYLGTQSKIGCFSLGVTKLITTGQGGVVVTRDKEIYDRLRSLQNQGDSANANEFDNGMGFNFKYTSIMAAIGKAQLARVPDRIAHLKAIYAKYEAGLSEFPFIKLIPVNVTHGELPLWVEAMSKERDMLRKFLSSKGIDTIELRPNLSLSPHLQNTGDSSGSTVFQDQGMGLPCGPDQPLENVDRVLETLSLYHKQR